MSDRFTHLSFYQFVRFDDPADLRRRRSELLLRGRDLELRGTILLASEGINGMVSGSAASIASFKSLMRSEYQVADSAIKEAIVPTHAFNRFLVKIKKEIISLGVPDLRPDQETGARISAAELKRWLDEKRPMHLIDTRNDYEVGVGTFEGAKDLAIDSFREFAEKAKTLAAELQSPENLGRPVVTFCTGGIRCEKASALLMKLGLKDVYQLDGGIIRYLEENGSRHFRGSCFVFDGRMAVDGELKAVPRSEDEAQKFGRHRKI